MPFGATLSYVNIPCMTVIELMDVDTAWKDKPEK